MKTLTSLAALLLALAAPAAAAAQHPGRGGDHGQAERGRGGDPGRGPPAARGHGEARGQDRHDDRGRGRDRHEERGRREVARLIRPAEDHPRAAPAGRRAEPPGRRDDARRAPREHDAEDVVRRVGSTLLFEPARERGLIAGCPPGLAKRDNGCLPPGQARKLAADRSWSLWAGDAVRYRFDDGYMYRLDRDGDLLGWLPALGGVLAVGRPWPAEFTAWTPAPDYYGRYYRLDDRYRYRYADGALYGVDPETQAIGSVVALLTGQPWTVGQPMPAGYDVYNLPYDYRDRYVDTADSWYRYSDGYVYQVDPTTRLVMAAIQLLA